MLLVSYACKSLNNNKVQPGASLCGGDPNHFNFRVRSIPHSGGWQGCLLFPFPGLLFGSAEWP